VHVRLGKPHVAFSLGKAVCFSETLATDKLPTFALCKLTA
jgi:hypothetical protein